MKIADDFDGFGQLLKAEGWDFTGKPPNEKGWYYI